MVDNTFQILQTFKSRACGYNSEDTWMEDSLLLELLVPNSFERGHLLDVCAGTGIISSQGLSKGWMVTAVDISIEMLRQIPTENSIRIIRSDAEQLPFIDKSFNIILCRQGLQYLDVDMALKEFARVSSSEIRLAHITMEHPEDLSYWTEYFKIISPGRKHIFKPNQISNICKRNGLEVIHEFIYINFARLNGSIEHLNKNKREKIKKWLEATPQWWKDRYSLRRLASEDTEYSQRWEIIIVKLV